jgi:hypothetical protein
MFLDQIEDQRWDDDAAQIAYEEQLEEQLPVVAGCSICHRAETELEDPVYLINGMVCSDCLERIR